MAISKKRQRFVDEYLKSFNATEAAIKAGYSEKTAYSIGWENLRIPEIAEMVSKRLQESAMSADEVLMRLGEQARAEYSKYIDMNGSVNLVAMLEDGKSHLIKGVKETKYGQQVEFYDSQTALSLLAKYHSLLTDRVVQTNYDLDLNSLSNEQIIRLANGENIAHVLGND